MSCHPTPTPGARHRFAAQSFFTKWWKERDGRQRRAFKRLVREGQFEFVNGGWVQHDEASTHYVSMIDQTTLGHRWGRGVSGVFIAHGGPAATLLLSAVRLWRASGRCVWGALWQLVTNWASCL